MNRIVAYAKERGLHIIPVINSPGHMDSIFSCNGRIRDEKCTL